MNIICTHSNEPAEARWTALWDDHPLGLNSPHHTRRCCDEGHPDPTAALAHGAALEQVRILDLIHADPADSWGQIVLRAAS